MKCVCSYVVLKLEVGEMYSCVVFKLVRGVCSPSW